MLTDFRACIPALAHSGNMPETVTPPDFEWQAFLYRPGTVFLYREITFRSPHA